MILNKMMSSYVQQQIMSSYVQLLPLVAVQHIHMQNTSSIASGLATIHSQKYI